jgi:formylglycine-generating enzyme required for sulfatase activity
MTRLFCLSLIGLLATQLSVPAQQKDPPKYVTNSAGMKFAWIPPGPFTMGSPKDEKSRNVLEIQHPVELTRGFYMGVFPVTQEQWRTVIRASDYIKPEEGFDLGDPSRFAKGGKLPVEGISWDDCQSFLKKLRKMDKQDYRLPTEAEWEYACRAGTTTPFYFGDTIATSQANYCGLFTYGKGVKGLNRQKTTPVGTFAPNAFGLYDMHGNVAQWCQDRFGKYPQHRVIDPQGPKDGGNRILRGGSWEDGPATSRSAARGWASAEIRTESGTVGVRLCFFPKPQ